MAPECLGAGGGGVKCLRCHDDGGPRDPWKGGAGGQGVSCSSCRRGGLVSRLLRGPPFTEGGREGGGGRWRGEVGGAVGRQSFTAVAVSLKPMLA